MGLRDTLSFYNNCCFFCIPLNIGVVILGVLGVICGGYQAIDGIITKQSTIGPSEIEARVISTTFIITNICYFVASMLAIYGGIKRVRLALFPYLLIVAIYILAAVVIAILMLTDNVDNHLSASVDEDTYWVPAAILLTVSLLNFHFWLVVYAFQEELGERSGSPTYDAV